VRSDGVDLPCGGLADTNLCFSNAGRFLSGRNSVPDEAGDLEFFCCLKIIINKCTVVGMHSTDLDIECCVESHLKMALIVLVEHSQEALLEDGGSK
jgi:hypothetical protein